MEFTKVFELSPIDGRKSFYGKANAVLTYTGRGYAVWECWSYNTRVCSYNSDTGEFTREWWGYSVTTMRHVNAFMARMGFSYGGKSWWDSLPVGTPVNLWKVG